MLITRETDYALRVLRALSDGGLHTAGEIAQGQLVPKPFAYKIIKKLGRAGLVSIVRGADGGCRLAADLMQVTLYDLMAAVESPVRLSACMDPGYPCPWREAHGGCDVHCSLIQVQRQLDAALLAWDLHRLIFGPSAEGASTGAPVSGAEREEGD